MHTLKKPTNNNTLKGRILCDQRPSGPGAIYAIGGISYDSFVLIQLFEQAQMNTVLYRKCYKVMRPINYHLPNGTIYFTEYADTTNIITKELSCLDKLTATTHGGAAPKLHKADMQHIDTLILGATTIPAHIKSKYFELN